MTSVNSDVWHYAEEGPNGVVEGESTRVTNSSKSVITQNLFLNSSYNRKAAPEMSKSKATKRS